jgi:predicted solute-binding protein
LKLPRIGCVKYLNARPLIHGWPGTVTFDHPSALCAKLAAGELDVALVSSFEFLRNPIYRIVDDVSISSAGPVYSVFVAHRGEISGTEEIELDLASQTSANLLRCLLAERGWNPRLVRNTDILSVGPAGVSPAESGRAQLLIGDQAIRFRQEHGDKFNYWDLGDEWKKVVDLPFVYALWLVRPEVVDPIKIAARLRALRDENIGKIDNLIAEEKEFDHDFCALYYREHLRFTFGEREKQALREFQRLCEKHGLLPKRNTSLNFV